jgi:hypothetical protein
MKARWRGPRCMRPPPQPMPPAAHTTRIIHHSYYVYTSNPKQPIVLYCVFSVTRICSRTRDWPACVAHAKNNFICVFIVKRDKRMRDAGRYHAAERPHA